MLVETDDFASRHRPRLVECAELSIAALAGGLGPTPPWDDGAPIRAELFSVERLEEHARSLAAAQVVTPGRVKGASLAKRLGRQRGCAPGGLSRCRRGHRRGRGDHACGRVADRQFPRGREADPRGPRRSAARLLSPAAQARRRTLRRISARVRRGLGVRGPYRQPLRPGGPAALPARLSGSAAAHHRRAVGGGDHPAHRAGREPQADRQADRRQPGRAPHRGRHGGPVAGRLAAASPNQPRRCFRRMHRRRSRTAFSCS